ncbi:putative fatty acid synthase subunit beta [Aspergillus clavatus NRRL 1]|uniref:Fatty acid synthase subunit beta, putative n=1 Tax=Aspergillus clavatus (strain ATCC 1007 / CBS 513.65 / DSM 816 / NCTC 3887 / NRRL 1 / QM 1276 / 107) TaxID=344612 RepID=A1CFM8_ASPCL|nr:fatty acid synthase subunit beta, putative [Aspergillus clavatus NRRL 1]EAW11677.1 fatty acid synthase subunit beta, putative [Aspergillus clavatus NRRL 1]
MDGVHQETSSSSLDLIILKEVLNFFQTKILQNENINTVLASMDGEQALDHSILRTYFKACALTKERSSPGSSHFLTQAQSGNAKLFALFNGQGVENYFDELAEAYNIYEDHLETLIRLISESLTRLAADDRVKDLFSHGLTVLQWLKHPDSRPDVHYLTTPAVSLPLIGLLQLVHYSIACLNLNVSPGELRQFLSGAAGHSQGVVVACFIASVDSRDSFYQSAQQAVEVLFWIGARCQQSTPYNLPLSSQDASWCMLSVKGLSQHTLHAHIDRLNAHLPGSEHVHLALVNGPHQLVVAGLPKSLRALEKVLHLKRSGNTASPSQSRIPYSQRPPVLHTRLLSIAAPFHSPYLQAAEELLLQDLASVSLDGADLAFPVFHTETAENLQQSANLIPQLVQMICTGRVQWEKLLHERLPGFTHVLDFGPGGDAGIGNLVNQQRDGTGLRTIIVSAHRNPSNALGGAGDLYARHATITYGPIWNTAHSPQLAHSLSDSHVLVTTRFSEVLGLPPVMVAGMTPTTTSPDFVAAIMNAGYHAELACGGFSDADKMRQGILSLAAAITPGRGITCNLIYANPRAMAWQIPLLAELRQSGVPITGLTIGAGVPSPDIVQGYISELSLAHIALKPGSKESIDAVLEIAGANPDFPIVLQWTGGRGGGHHSYEDFHEPILDRYGQIRSHRNVILVAGSGFGNGEGSYPYLTGSWSERFGRPRMPFDAVLLGSRVMASQEAHTSPAVKQAICQIPGVTDAHWEGTYTHPTGGILTVRSEMGEPIHKLATRGVMLWAELDKDIFSLPREKQKEALLARKEYYIRRLNDDFQKVWFGCNAKGEIVDLHEMTYAEVWQRLVSLLYLNQTQQWIDPSFRTLVADFTRLLEERLGPATQNAEAALRSLNQLDEPEKFQAHLFARYPQAKIDVITAADAEYFILLSRRRGQKPVPYIVALDEDLEFWFKKDSLWQSERLEAVPGQDVGRVCILHGPVAAQYTTTANEPVQSILDGINEYYIQGLLRDCYGGSLENVPSNLEPEEPSQLKLNGFAVEQLEDEDTVRYSAADPNSQLSPDDWLTALAGACSAPWCRAIFTEQVVIQGTKMVSNPIRRLFNVARGRIVEVRNPHSPKGAEIFIKEFGRSLIATATVRNGYNDGEIILTFWDHTVAKREAVPLEFHFDYKPRTGGPSIIENMTGRSERIKRYYQTIWVGKQPSISPATDVAFRGEDVVLTRTMIKQFAQSILNHNSAYTSTPESVPAPLDLAIAIGWKPLMSCLFTPLVSGDMLRLLHLSNSFELLDGVETLREGDRISPEGRLTAIRIRKGSGKVVEAEGLLRRNGSPVIRVRSTFILTGEYTDYENTFAVEEESFRLALSSKKDLALLKSRPWLFLNEQVDLDKYLGRTIEFHVRTRSSFGSSDTYSHLSVEGQVVYVADMESPQILGTISLAGDSYTKSPVTDYLQRHGSRIDNCPQTLPQAHVLLEDLHVVVPDYADQYGQASGDCNPIHLSDLFAGFAGHDNRVTHGMFTSGLIRGIVESHVADNDPSRMRSWSCNFEGKVTPADQLSVRIEHVGMSQGKMLLSVHVKNAKSGVKVLSAKATVDQPLMAYVFTGQGSQQPGMGMELAKQSPSAEEVWRRADKYFENTYGFSITRIVRDNPKSLTVHFGGTHGRAIRDNYISLTFDLVDDSGAVTSRRVFPEITKSTRSYTFRSADGLLHETQFTQPALALMEIARFEDMRSNGVVREDSLFAGHSLGEYVALTAMGRLFSIEEVASLVFYRGLTMQNAVKRDANGVTDYSMCAVNPTRVSKSFGEKDLHWCVDEIARQSGGLLEIVNYNVANMQYVCAGDLRGLAALGLLMDSFASKKLDISKVEEVQDFIQRTLSVLNATSSAPVLQRGRATIPLKVNVPFHSSLLRPGVDSFRYLLRNNISESMLDPSRLVGKYIPNLTAQPFELSREYVQGIQALTKSPILEDLLRNVSGHQSLRRPQFDNTDIYW